MRWFKHDADANRDPKLEKVLMRYGAEGYALYWLCIELIAAPIDKHNITFELEHDAEILAHRLRMDSNKVEEIMHYMVGLGLFEMDASSSRITCLKLATRLENSIVKNPNLKEAQLLIKSGINSDCPGQCGNLSENSGIVRLDIDTDLELEKDLTTGVPVVVGGKPPTCPHEAIVSLYHEVLPTLTAVRKLTPARRQQLRARWREGNDDLAGWRRYFEHVSTSDFLMGRSAPRNGTQHVFAADLEWLTKASNFAKVIEGKYHHG